MHFSIDFALALAACTSISLAQSVSGKAPGFASGTTGGASGQTVTPSTVDELVSYLTSSEPLTIVLEKEFDFTGTEGTASGTGCAPWGTGSGCQLAINQNDWCSEYQSDAPSVSVTYDKAATSPIDVASDKSIVGVGSSAVIKGKGLRFAGGVSNVILQNVHITELNPKYVWGGDAITLDGSQNIWIDHVKISLIGREHIVTGYNANTGIAITNTELDGRSEWSATCDGNHYWALYITGEGDQITFKGNYIHHTSGRAPKVGGGALLHVVNNYWSDISGHAFEGENAYVLVEGSTFENVNTPSQDFTASLYAPSSSDSACQSALGRACAGNSGAPAGSASSVLSQFGGLTVADADSNASGVLQSAGVGKMSSKSQSTPKKSSVVRRSVPMARKSRDEVINAARAAARAERVESSLHEPRRLWVGADEEDVFAYWGEQRGGL